MKGVLRIFGQGRELYFAFIFHCVSARRPPNACVFSSARGRSARKYLEVKGSDKKSETKGRELDGRRRLRSRRTRAARIVAKMITRAASILIKAESRGIEALIIKVLASARLAACLSFLARWRQRRRRWRLFVASLRRESDAFLSRLVTLIRISQWYRKCSLGLRYD